MLPSQVRQWMPSGIADGPSGIAIVPPVAVPLSLSVVVIGTSLRLKLKELKGKDQGMVTTKIHEERSIDRSQIMVLEGIKTSASPMTIYGVTGIGVVLETHDKMATVLIPQDICEEFALGLLAKARKFGWSKVQ